MLVRILLSFISLFWIANNKKLTVTSVSTAYSTTTSTMIYGSSQGGTLLYIRGTGFQSNPSLNNVFVGDYPCIIPSEGLKQESMYCTTSSIYPKLQSTQLPITVISNKQKVTAAVIFVYTYSYTPELREVYPFHSYAGQKLNFVGIHRISDLGDGIKPGKIVGLYTGAQVCSRVGINQKPINSILSTQYITCYQSWSQEAGKYLFKQIVELGIAKKNLSMTRSSIEGSKYEYVVFPTVRSVSPKNGSVAGQKLTISGSGFPLGNKDKDKVLVSVDNTQCQIVQVSNDQVICNLKKKSAQSSKIVNSVNSSGFTYASGSGFKYKRYQYTDTIQSFQIAQINSLASLKILEENIKGQLYSKSFNSSAQIQTFEGYFFAPKPGVYTFLGHSTNSFKVYLNKLSGVPVYNKTQDLLIYGSESSIYQLPYQSLNTQKSKIFMLDGPKHYFMKVYNKKSTSADSFRVMAQIPNQDPNVGWKVPQIHEFKTSFTNQPLLMRYRSLGACSGKLKLLIQKVNPDTLQVIFNKSIQIPYNASSSTFCATLVQFQNAFQVSSNNPICELKFLDESLQQIVSPQMGDEIYGYEWSVRYDLPLINLTSQLPIAITQNLFQFSYINAQSVTGEDPVFTQQKIQQHGTLINGTFKIISNGSYLNFTSQSIDFPYNVNAKLIQTALKNLYPNQNIIVTQKEDHPQFKGQFGKTWTIYYQYTDTRFPLLQFQTDLLMGGMEGTFPTVTLTVIKGYSTNLYFNPINFQLMRTFTYQPAVVVKVNNVTSICLMNNCQFKYLDDTPQVSLLQINEDQNLISLQLTSDILTSNSKVFIYINDQNACEQISIKNNNSLVCYYLTNQDGKPIFTAGTYLPAVYIQGIGFLEYLTTVLPLQFQFQVKNPQPNTVSALGGQEIILSGKGFPKSFNDLTLKVCDKIVDIQNISGSKIIFISPQVKQDFVGSTLDCRVQLTFQNYSTGQLFMAGYLMISKVITPPTILDLNKRQANPTKKNMLQIYGSDFDSESSGNLSSVVVTLKGVENGKIYRMRVFQLNNTRIKVGLSGGITGKYTVNVQIKGKGLAIPYDDNSNIFEYVNKISSISPFSGSYFGGRQIQIFGSQFSDDILQNQIRIGSQICRITKAQKEKLTCITPQKDQKVVDLQLDVQVISRQISKSICDGNCKFIYNNSETSPFIIKVSNSSMLEENVQIILYGQNLQQELKQTIVTLINKISQKQFEILPILVNLTHLMYLTISVPAGYYDLFVSIQDFGLSNSIEINVNPTIKDITPAVSSQGGILTIQGFGFPQTFQNQPFQLEITDLIIKQIILQNKILSANSTKICIQIPPRKINDKYQVNIGISKTVKNMYNIAQNTTSTAQLISRQIVDWKNTQKIILLLVQNSNFIPQKLTLYSSLQPQKQIQVQWQNNQTHIIINNTLQPGNYKFKIFNSQSGYYKVNQSLSIILPNAKDKFTFTASNLSYEGGYVIFRHDSQLPHSFGQLTGLFINNQKTSIISINQTASKLIYLPYVKSDMILEEDITNQDLQIDQKQKLQYISESKNQKTQKINIKKYIRWSDSGSTELTDAAFDSYTKTSYISQNQNHNQNQNQNCIIGVYFGAQQEYQISKIRYYPDKAFERPGLVFQGALFQGSADNISWTDIYKLNQKVNRGWNNIQIDKKNRTAFRYFRFIHNSQSNCRLSEIVLRGIKINNILSSAYGSSQPFPQNSFVLSYSDGLNKIQWDNVFQYSSTQTPIVETVLPLRGRVQGGQQIVINGKGFALGTPQVIIDDKICLYIQHNQTSIRCRTSSRLEVPKLSSFKVYIGGKTALTKQQFTYVLRWSDLTTWGVDPPPVDGDLIYVPPGMHLYIDQSTPQLAGIIAENSTIQIADESDIQIKTANIILTGAKLIAGTLERPFMHQLTFIFFGKQQDAQIPFFGNKGIGCADCQILLHGKPKTAWTNIKNILQNTSFVILNQTNLSGWQVNDQIVVSSSSFESLQSQKMTLVEVEVSENVTLFTKQKFKYNHTSSLQDTKTQKIFIGSQVASLTRNIKLQGDQNSDNQEYGIHLTFIGNQESGLQVQISNIELKNCGQPKKQRHCINFNRNEDLPTSYIINSTASQTYAKFISLSSTNYVKIQSNIGYKVKGHNIELKDGTQQNNVIQHNLMISALPYYRNLQTDVMVASFYISNPNNVIKNNVAAGSYYYGFLYDFKSKPEDGIYAKDFICSSGYKIGQNSGNIAHSTEVFGVRIKQLYARTSPCDVSRNGIVLDPWSSNPSKQSILSDYLIYKNKNLGLMCDQIGHITFENFTMVQNWNGHMEFHIMNFTKQNVVVKDSTFIGAIDLINSPQNISTKSIVLPRSGSINLTNILFSKFTQNQLLVETCSLCDQVQFYTNTGQEYFTEQIQYKNILGNYLRMLGLKKDIIYDMDGTFSKDYDNIVRTKATIVKGFDHIKSEPGCHYLQSSNIKWDFAAVCNSNLTVRKVTFMNVLPLFYINFYPVGVLRLNNISGDAVSSQQISSVYQFQSPSKQIPNSWSAPFICGSNYKIVTGFDFNHIDIQISSLFQSNDKAIIFKFMYVITRQLFDVFKIRNSIQYSLLSPSSSLLNSNTCSNGDYFHNNTARQLHICASGKNSTLFELVDINAVVCRFDCPRPPVIIPDDPVDNTGTDTGTDTGPVDLCTRERFYRKWSNETQWPSNRLPIAGQNVTVHCSWNMELDIDPAPAAQLIIDGNLTVPQNRQLINITAESIWVRVGSLTFGTQNNTFDKKVVIQLNGKPDDRGIVIDSKYGGRKNMVVSGRLQIYGPQDYDQQSYLQENVLKGSNSIKVKSTTGWKVGNEIVISTSSRYWYESQKVKITFINGQNINFTPSLKYFHYGSDTPSVISSSGNLNTASKVIYVTRNIKIIAGPIDSFGFSVYVYGFFDQNQYQMGSVFMRGVQFVNGGQSVGKDPALAFTNTVSSSLPSHVTKCSFTGCDSECIKISNAKNLFIQKNVFFNAKRAHIKAVQLRQSSISQNIMIGSKKDPISLQNLTVCLQNRQMVNTTSSDNLSIFSNECYGSQDIGFILPYLPCSNNGRLISANIASACEVGFFLIKLQKQTSKCLLCQNSKAFNCHYGIVGNPEQTTNLTYSKLTLTGNKESLIMRFNSKQKNNTAYLLDSYISAISNPSCAQCNQIAQLCSQNVGVRLLSVTQIGSKNKNGYTVTQIKSPAPLDAKTFIKNVQFVYFNLKYTNFAQLALCSNNVIFRAHEQAIDLVGSTHLFQSSLIEADISAVAYFKPFQLKYLSLQGGCGELNCTSLQNYFIQDHTGQVLGAQNNKLLPNNIYFANKTLGCQYKQQMNGYLCNSSQQVAVLEFQSIARDYNSRIVWPINLISHSDDNINNTLNVQKEWSYKNGYPEGKRITRLSTLFKLNNTYNLTFFNRAPSDMIFQIQQKQQGPQSFGWIKFILEYPDDNSVRVKANDKDINPIILLDNRTQQDTSIQVCGSYKYVYDKKYIQYVLTTDCKIRMSFVNSVKATIRLDQAVDNFFTSNGTGKFIDKMCSILGITDTSRLKIVGIYTGSTIVDFYIEDQQTTTEDTATSAPPAASTASTVQQLSQTLNQAVSSGSLQSLFTSSGLGSILAVSSSVVIVNQAGQFQTVSDKSQSEKSVNYFDDSKSMTVIIIAATTSGCVILMVILVLYFKCVKKSNSIQDISVASVDEMKQVNMQNSINFEASQEKQISYFNKRIQINKNLQIFKKGKKGIKSSKFTSLQNKSIVSIKNPFDEYYMPQQSIEQFSFENMEAQQKKLNRK